MKQRLFGPGRGESLDRAQLRLHLDEPEKIAAAQRPTETVTRATRPAQEDRVFDLAAGGPNYQF